MHSQSNETSFMNIWVDADACPVPIKELIFRAAQRTGLQFTFVANHRMKMPKARNITFKLVESGFDVADDYIAQAVRQGDLVITNDIPLADATIERQGNAISTKGELFTKDNIKQRLNMRDFMDTLRASGVNTGGSPPLNNSDIKRFADALDRLLTQHLKGK